MTFEKFFDGWTAFNTAKVQKILIETILKYTSSNDKILEIGAGSGLTSLLLYYSNRNITISDFDNKVLNKIQNFPLNISIQKLDMFNLELDNNSYDCIFHQGLLEHFGDEEIINSLKEQSRVSRLIIFDIPNNKRFCKFQEFGNERFLSVKHWIELIEKSNLQVIEISGRRFSKVFNYLPVFLQDLKYIRKTFGTASIFVCKAK